MSVTRTRPPALLIVFCAAVCISSLPAEAQESSPPPAHISFVEGAVTIDHDGEVQPAVVNMPLVGGDRVRTEDGRVEVMFPDGSAIEIDPQSEVEVLGDWRVRVLAGTIEHRPARAPDPRSISAQYLSPGLQPYAPSLDQNGSWQYESSYGNVWYPTVAADWRPYYDGYWSPIGAYGWTWIGFGTWAWPTHHFGRWGFAHARWFWIPGRTWGPAWVSWALASNYVSWCPLGFDSRPVFGFAWSGADPYFRHAGSEWWRGWTVVSRDRFGSRGFSVRRAALEPRGLASTTPFVVQRTGPSFSRQSPVISRQSPVISRQSPVISRQSPAISRQSPVAVPRSSVTAPRAPAWPDRSALSRQAPVPPRYAPVPVAPRQPSAVDRAPAARSAIAPQPRARTYEFREPQAPESRGPRAPDYRSPGSAPQTMPHAVPRAAPPPPRQSAAPAPASRSAPPPAVHSAPPHSSGSPHASSGTATRRR
jgi:uncharacterized protein DUF6600